MCQLLEIPELVNLVLGQMSRPDQARFLQVSRSAFYLAVPFVWHSLQTASVLFELVHGISYKSIPGSEGEVIELPDPLDDLHTARFRFYAGFVKKVILHRATNRIHDLPVKARYRTRLENFLNWQSLLDYSSKQAVLPKLVAIEYRDFSHSAVLNWLRVLLSSSVRSLNITNPAPQLLPDILSLLAFKSPSLAELTVLPKDLTGGHGDPPLFNQQPFTERFSDFQELQTLECTLAIFHPQALLMLGALPHLRRIIVDVGGAPNLTYDSDLPDICFPSLQELCVERMAPAWATSLCFLKPLLKPLSSVSVSVLHHWSDNAVLGEHWADLLLLCLSENAPYLSRLSVLTATDGPSVVPALISLDVQEAMSRLSLKTLSLDNAHFGDSTGCAFLSSAWLGIEELRCGLQKCKPAELALFARNLSQLKGLELDTDMSGSSIPYSSTQISSDSPRYTAFRRLTSSTSKTYQRSPEQTITLARYLYALWPNVCCTFAEDESFGTMGIFSYERDAHRQLQCLNTCIAQVQAESS